MTIKGYILIYDAIDIPNNDGRIHACVLCNQVYPSQESAAKAARDRGLVHYWTNAVYIDLADTTILEPR